MAYVDIDLFYLENMIKQTRILVTQVKTFLFLQSTKEEDPLGNQNMNKKHCLEEGEFKKEGSPILTLTVCTRSYLSIVAKPQMQPIMITLDVKACGFTSKGGMNHSKIPNPMGYLWANR